MKRKIKNILKWIIGLIFVLDYEIFKNMNPADYLKHSKYISYKYLPSFSNRKYLKIKEFNENLLIHEVARQKDVHFCFVVYSSTMWFFDELYKLLNEEEHTSASILIGHCVMNNRESSNVEFEKTKAFFEDKGYKIISSNEIKEYDILFYLSPFPFYEKNLNIQKLKMTHLLLHVSYSYMLSGNMEKLGYDMYHWSFRYYTDSKYYLEMLSKYIKKYSDNARYLGFPKMDSFYSVKENEISSKKIIIYAPHHSVNYLTYKSATFEKNYRFMLELAKKYTNETYWIYKPHPLLRDHSVVAGIFESQEQYDEYVKEWAGLENGSVADSGDYFSLFKSSSAMVTDSVSFLAEYQFTGKPLLLLESGMEEYNDFGNKIVEILYKCKGDDFKEIEEFVCKIINGEDPNKNIRDVFFEENLGYKDNNIKTANGRIFNDLHESIIDINIE